MRDRFVELIPLLLVGVVLIAFQLSRGSSPALLFQALPELTPTPVEVAGVLTQPTRWPAGVTAQAAGCTTAQPQFTGGLAALKASLGAHGRATRV